MPIFCVFCRFLQFSTLESCYIWFTISLEYPSAYVHSCCPGKIQNQGLSGGIRGYKNPILSLFRLFFEIFCLFLQFSTFESCYIWFTVSLKYLPAYVYSCCPRKIQNQGLSWGFRGYVNPILCHFYLFSVIFCLFLQFPTLESCYIWFSISLEYANAYLHCFCPRKIQNRGLSGGIRGCVNPIFAYFLWFFVFFFSFPRWNHILFGLQLV